MKAVYYTVIKHDGHYENTRTARVFYISRVFSDNWSVLSQCNTWLRLLYLLYDTDFTRAKQENTLFYVLYSDTHRFLTNQSARRVLSVL